jgi:hypothetical protein
MADKEKKAGKKGDGSRGQRGGQKQTGRSAPERTEGERARAGQERGPSGELGPEERELGKRGEERGGEMGRRPMGETPPSQ